MNYHNDPFTINLPSIDLHSEDRVNALIMVDDFIKDSIKLKEYKIVIIHGKGSGILKNAVHEFLNKDKRIEKFYLDINIGQTIVELKRQ